MSNTLQHISKLCETVVNKCDTYVKHMSNIRQTHVCRPATNIFAAGRQIYLSPSDKYICRRATNISVARRQIYLSPGDKYICRPGDKYLSPCDKYICRPATNKERRWTPPGRMCSLIGGRGTALLSPSTDERYSKTLRRVCNCYH